MRRPLPVYRFFQADKNKAAAEEEAEAAAEEAGKWKWVVEGGP